MRKMKDSGIEWIGKIPENWNIKQIKTIAKIYNGKEIEEELDCNDPNSIRVFGSGGVFKYTNKPLYKGEAVLFGRKGTIGKPMIASGEFWTVDTMYYSVCNQENDNRFLYYILTVFPWEPFTTQTALPSVVATEIFRNSIGVPSLSEQKKIADFLDGKCADIDQIKADIEKQIEILTDYKKSVITEAVTKGLDPKVKLKDSGIEWIGKIPNGWKTLKVKYLATEPDSLFTDGDWINSDIITEEGVRYLTSGNVGEGYFKKQGDGYISQETFDQLHCLKALPNDLMICRLNLPIGRSCIIPNDEPFYVVAVDNVILRPNHDIDKKFIMYCMNTPGYAAEAEMAAGGTTMKRISRTDLGNLIVPIPSLEEQLAIASYLDEKCSEIDATITEKQKQLETLEEYKKSLIFEYVTGKKEVV